MPGDLSKLPTILIFVTFLFVAVAVLIRDAQTIAAIPSAFAMAWAFQIAVSRLLR